MLNVYNWVKDWEEKVTLPKREAGYNIILLDLEEKQNVIKATFGWKTVQKYTFNLKNHLLIKSFESNNKIKREVETSFYYDENNFLIKSESKSNKSNHTEVTLFTNGQKGNRVVKEVLINNANQRLNFK